MRGLAIAGNLAIQRLGKLRRRIRRLLQSLRGQGDGEKRDILEKISPLLQVQCIDIVESNACAAFDGERFTRGGGGCAEDRECIGSVKGRLRSGKS